MTTKDSNRAPKSSGLSFSPAYVTRSTLGEVNGGRCGNANNCRYTGRSVCYVVNYRDAYGHDDELAFNRKWAANGLADWINSGGWDRVGDAESAWINNGGYSVARYISDDNAKAV